jgi:hypothetical protein
MRLNQKFSRGLRPLLPMGRQTEEVILLPSSFVEYHLLKQKVLSRSPTSSRSRGSKSNRHHHYLRLADALELFAAFFAAFWAAIAANFACSFSSAILSR